MNTIEAFIIEQREEEATSFLQKFSKLIRAVLENAQNDAIPLAFELEVLEWYIQLEQIRANQRWVYEIHVSTDLDKDKVQVPPLILQPFVENAILHGLYHRTQKGGELQIAVAQDEQGILRVSISDNGIGRQASASKNTHLAHKKKSLGTQFSMERVQKLNPQNKLVYDVSITDLYPDRPDMSGTVVELSLPGK
jgi:LytS/YehU family sensor histidine kinase